MKKDGDNRQEINLEEYKKIILDILKFFDNFCRKNNIKYSLFGGSLIGAIRHSGFVPWDDDIDIIMMPEDYDRFINLFNNENEHYKLYSYKNNNNFYYSFVKLIDTRLYIKPEGMKEIPNYGPFIDIFRYNYLPENFFVRKIYLLKYSYYIKMINGYSKETLERNPVKRLRTQIAHHINITRFINKFDKMLEKYNKKATNNIIANYTTVSLNKAIQKTNNFISTRDIIFEDMNAMIANGSEEILKNTFGDYMKLPPKEEQIAFHKIHAYWKK